MTIVSIYNTSCREKQSFEPIDPNNIRIYVCGPTVYDFAHVGNARPIVVFDTFVCLLRRVYGDQNITYVRNITDIDDKIIAAANQEGVSIDHLTERTIRLFHEDMAALNAKSPDYEPRATEYLPEMIEMILSLLDKGHAYFAEGHVLFDTTTMADYGVFARHSRDELIAGARVEVAPYKRNPMDFVLWKPSHFGQPGWDSPWGEGRPGWHLECSVMSEAILGKSFDIHGGGIDLVFPHHQNEIAQSTCLNGKNSFARYWMHNGHVTVASKKMSKSRRNFLTIHDLLGRHSGESIRLTLLSAHYRQPMNFNEAALIESRKILDRWYRAIDGSEGLSSTSNAVDQALSDDLNTPKAIVELHRLADQAMSGDKSAKRELRAGGLALGVLSMEVDEWFRGDFVDEGIDEVRIQALIEERIVARRGKNFEKSDRIREELATHGIVLEDNAKGTIWRRSG